MVPTLIQPRLARPGVMENDATTGVIAADPGTDIDVGTAGGLLPDVVDFDPTSAWGDGDQATAAIPDGANFDPTSLDLAWGDGDDATAAIPAARKRKRRSKHSHVVQDACKRQRAAALLLTTQGNTETGT